MKTKVLFICVHNSPRSQMAEAWLNKECSEVFEAHSAGLEPGRLNPLVVEAMQEVGIDISHKQTQSVFEVLRSGKAFAYVIAVCDQTSGERCPIFPGVARRLDWSFPDPSQFRGNPEAQLEQVRAVRDSIRARIEDWCTEVCPRVGASSAFFAEIHFMKLHELKKTLAQHSDRNIHFVLPTGTNIPPHAHVTDVARIDKQFIDCGGTIRTESLCRLQAWFADDTEHRIGAKMLLKVLEKAGSFLASDDLDVDVEYEAPFISQFPIVTAAEESGVLVIRLGIRHTACLAQDKCLPPMPKAEALSFKPLPNLQPAKCC